MVSRGQSITEWSHGHVTKLKLIRKAGVWPGRLSTARENGSFMPFDHSRFGVESLGQKLSFRNYFSDLGYCFDTILLSSASSFCIRMHWIAYDS